jgi:hypothetical protein
MNEQRLARALREGPPFATHYVARPLRLTHELGRRTSRAPRRAVLLLAVAALLLAALGALAIAGGSVLWPKPSASPQPTPSARPAPLTGFASCDPTGDINSQIGPPPGFCPGRLPAGTYTTRAFLPGMMITVPDGRWVSTLDVPWAFTLRLADHPAATMYFDLDPAATDGERVLPADTPSGLLSRFKSNSNLVISSVTNRTIGDGIAAQSFGVDLSDRAPHVDPSCALTSKAHPFSGRQRPLSCYSYFTLGGQLYGSAKGEPVMMYLAQIGGQGTRHILLVILDNLDPSDSAGWTQLVPAADEVLATIKLPVRLPIGS